MRIRLTVDITRGRRAEQSEPEFEHRDNDTMVESQPGWPETHRMGFAPPPEDDPQYRARP